MKKILSILGILILASCAAPREAQRVYDVRPQQVVIFYGNGDQDLGRFLKALEGGIILNVPINLVVDLEKKQDTKATADISPTVDVVP
jgi:hypothetical protein